MLKKIGVWKWHHKDYEKNGLVYRDIQVLADLYMNYFNHRTLAYEPLLEPWYIHTSVTQFTRYTQQEIVLNSQKMLNINMTFGMAMTIKKIKERVLESMK